MSVDEVRRMRPEKYVTFNRLHPRINFILELESQSYISFLDVSLKQRSDGSVQRCTYKNTWKKQYIILKALLQSSTSVR